MTLVLQSARYVYDGDGTQVKSVVTYFARQHYHKEANSAAETIRKIYGTSSL
jgi:hypothetical protein